jgi:hypothetical protein
MDTPVSGSPRLLLRAEGRVVLVAAYLAGPRTGALAYNACHTYLAPAALAGLTYAGVIADGWPLCLIWVAHIGLDRTLGLGLKFGTAFRDTHLGTVGRSAPAV